MSNLTVFICSTYSDLSSERASVLDTIRRLQLQHDSMEFFGARSDQPIETCLSEVRRSNILVVIVGHRYGTLVPEMGVSFSEAEYTEGYRLKKPCLVYIRDENIPVLPKYIERDPEKLRLLERWKATLQHRHTIAAFRDGTDLAVQVAVDLSHTINGLDEAERDQGRVGAESTVAILEEVTALISRATQSGVTEAALLSSLRRSVSALIADVQHLPTTVFFSYAHHDSDIVDEVAERLSRAGVRTWRDTSNIQIGTDWKSAIHSALDSVNFLVFFISQKSIESGFARTELNLILGRQVAGVRGATVLPVLLENVDDVPPLLRNIQWIDMTDGSVDRAAKQLVEAIRYYSGQES